MRQTSGRVPVALTVAGSDSGGGAGIQADLKTFAFHQVHGVSAITCVTAQNTEEVSRVDALPSEAVTAQIESVVGDIGVDAVKTGMLLNASIIEAVSAAFQRLGLQTIVVDPVMVSRTGSQLIDDSAIALLKHQLIPQAFILTPNRYEAQILSGLSISTQADMILAAQKIHDLGPRAVLIKGGGLRGDLLGLDVWFDGQQESILTTEAISTQNTHGTGCTLSAAIAANLARGLDLLEASRQAKLYVTQALRHALQIGRGQGPIGHFYPLKKHS